MSKWNYRLVPARGNILVIAPHPDDEIIGCGGTLLKHLMVGDNVKVLFLTNGIESGTDYEVRKSIRLAECRAVLDRLQIDAFLWDENVIVDSSEESIERLIRIINITMPDLIYIPSIEERNKDHRMAAILLKNAIAKMMNLEFWICEYAVWSPINPNLLVNITEVFFKKISLLKLYESELKKYNYLKLVESSGAYYLNLFHSNRSDFRVFIEEHKLFKASSLNWDYAEPFILSNRNEYVKHCEFFLVNMKCPHICSNVDLPV